MILYYKKKMYFKRGLFLNSTLIISSNVFFESSTANITLISGGLSATSTIILHKSFK